MTLQSAGSRVFQFTRSIVVLAALAVGVPAALVWAARERFGGAMPFHGVPSPADWELDRIVDGLTDRLTEQTVADIVIRTSLAIAWVALAVFLLTVVAEAVHMLRHGGLHLPDVRGLGLGQPAARALAAGLLVLLPMFASPARVIARGDTTLTPMPRAAAAHVAPHVEAAGRVAPGPIVVGGAAERQASTVEEADRAAPPVRADDAAPRPTRDEHAAPATAPAAAGTAYVVRPGDSVFGIATQVAGPDPGAIADYADHILEINLGRDMDDGRRFSNAAFIDVGWTLELPALPSAGVSAVAPPADDAHVVEGGESLWSIAADELGDPTRWPEVYAANEGRTFDDGRTLADPDLIHPGWELAMPGASAADQAVTPPPDDVAVEPSGDVDDDVEGDVDDDVVSVADAAPLPADPGWDAPAAEAAHEAPAPDIVWVDPGGASVVPVAPADPVAGATGTPAPSVVGDGSQVEAGAVEEANGLVSLRAAAMLSGGVLTLLAARRRRQLRQAPPRAELPPPTPQEAAVERALRAVDAGERLARVDIAIRAAAHSMIDQGRRVRLVMCGPDGELELFADGTVELPSPWHGEHETWWLPAATPIELLAPAARQVGAPSPTLVQLGVDEIGRDVYADLEAFQAIEIGGSAADADAIVAAIAMTLAGSALAEVVPLLSVGVPDDAFLGHRLHLPVRDPDSAFDEARRAIGATANVRTSTFELRARATSGEAWEPAVVLIGAGVDVVRPPRDRTGLAVVSAAPIEGPSSRLAPENGTWILRPAGLRLRPVGLQPADLDAVADLVAGAAAIPTIPDEDDMTLHDELRAAAAEPSTDDTIYPDRDDVADEAPADGPGVDVGDDEEGAERVPESVTAPRSAPVAPVRDVADWQLLVRLLGPVDVIDRDGRAVLFERTKTLELVAWLGTHRRRSTRMGARTALWEQDVRDATFANVVSEARRSMARLVEPAVGEEWVGRSMSDLLPLHGGVVTDVEVLEQALGAARLQPPDQAIVTLTPAVELIRGMPFEGAAYLWPDAEGLTSNLILLTTSAAAELAAHCLSVGDIEGVFRSTGCGLTVLPGHEELIGLRMRAHARAGDLAGVRSEWETYERMINADPWSDGEPSPKLVDLRQQLLHPSR